MTTEQTTRDEKESPRCAVCTTEQLHGSRAGWTVCEPCEASIREDLNTIEHLWLELPRYLVPGRGATGERVASSPGGSRPPARLDVLDLLGPGGVPDRLAVHEDAWRAARGFHLATFRGNADQRVGAVIGFLRAHLDWACRHYPDVDDLAADLTELIGAVRAATDSGGRRPDPPAPVGVACPVLVGGHPCGSGLAFDPCAGTLSCPACGTTQPTTAWLALGA